MTDREPQEKPKRHEGPRPCRGACDACLRYGICYEAVNRWKGHS